MLDAIKKFAGRMFENGASYLRHAGAIEQILNSPTEQAGAYRLRDYVFGLDGDSDFQRFKAAILYQHQLAQQAQMSAGDAWGVSTEDRIAYQRAHMIAGEPTGAMVAQRRQYYLQLMYQMADQFWLEARQLRAQPPPPPPAVPG